MSATEHYGEERYLIHGFQKLGGIIALIQAISFVLLLLAFGVLLPGQGLAITGLNDPSKVVPVIASGSFALLNAVTVADAVMVVLVVLAVYERPSLDHQRSCGLP